MSISEAKRFIADVEKNKGLVDRVKPHASGLAALTAGAKAHGYDFTADELKQAMRDKTKRNLDDAQLDAIAGGQQQVTTANDTAVSNAVLVTFIGVYVANQSQQIVLVAGSSAVSTLVV
jgi:predicted ribosomally synthesized peptide with nif11-like leader